MSQAQPHLIGSDQIRERESNQREGDQIRERERVRSERERKRLRKPAQAARPGLCDLGRASLGRAAQAMRPKSCEPRFISSSSLIS